MPSFFKRLLLGKELSNPYVNPYHQGHRAKVSAETHPTSPQALPSAETRTNPYVKHYVSHESNAAAGTDKALGSASRGAAQASIEQGQAGRVYSSILRDTVRGNVNESEEDYDDDRNQTPSPTLLEEARRAAGRDPITGKALRKTETKKQKMKMKKTQAPEQFTSYAARSAQSAPGTVVGSPREAAGYFAPERPVRDYYGSGV
jgi:hypothetical protein